jgi:hypothetical protein
MTTNPPLQKTLKGILHREDENKLNHKRTGSLNLMRRTDKHSDSSIELAARTQILKQKNNQLNGRNHYIPLKTNTEC